MSTTTHTYDTTFEWTEYDTVTASVEARITYTFTPGRPASFSDPVEDYEIEFVKAEEEGPLVNGKRVWVPAQDAVVSRAESFVESHADKLAASAAEDRQPDPDDARDQRIDREMADRS